MSFAEDTWTLLMKIDGADYSVSSRFHLNGIATMPYPSNHILIWGSVLFHRYQCNSYLRNRLPVGGGCIYVLQIFFIFCFFLFFSVHQNYETTVLRNG